MLWPIAIAIAIAIHQPPSTVQQRIEQRRAYSATSGREKNEEKTEQSKAERTESTNLDELFDGNQIDACHATLAFDECDEEASGIRSKLPNAVLHIYRLPHIIRFGLAAPQKATALGLEEANRNALLPVLVCQPSTTTSPCLASSATTTRSL